MHIHFILNRTSVWIFICRFLGKIAVVVFTQLDIVDVLFNTVYDEKLHIANRFIWIGGDGWTGYSLQRQEVAVNALGVRPKIKEVEEFDEYFMKYVVKTALIIKRFIIKHYDFNWKRHVRWHVLVRLSTLLPSGNIN